MAKIRFIGNAKLRILSKNYKNCCLSNVCTWTFNALTLIDVVLRL